MLVVKNLKKLFESFLYSSFSNLESGAKEDITPQTSFEKKAAANDDMYSNEETLSQDEQKELADLTQQYNDIKANLKYVSEYGSRIQKGLETLKNTESANDPEFVQFSNEIAKKMDSLGAEYGTLSKKGKDTQEKLEDFKKLLDSAKTQIDSHEFKMGIDMDKNGKIEKNAFSPEKLATLNNLDILSLPVAERLRYVTESRTSYSEIVANKGGEIIFNFDANRDGTRNEELYKKTTLGQVLGAEVGVVESGGETYTRLGKTGEFFNGNARLLVKDNTVVTIKETRSPDAIKVLSEGNQKKYDMFFENNSDYDQTKFGESVRVAIEEGIEPLLFANLTNRRIEDLGVNPSGEKIEIESLVNELGQTLSGLDRNLHDGKYSLETTAELLRFLTPVTWKVTMTKELGFEQADVLTYATKTKDVQRGGISKLHNYIPGEYSYPVERSDSGTTLCSRTARKNLARMGITDAKWGTSAKNSYEQYGKKGEPFPPSADNNAKVADFYLDASAKNAEYGHRVAAFKNEQGNWMVMDPYYNIVKGQDNRIPVPAEEYVRVMEGKNPPRKMWGAHYFDESGKKG